MKGKEVLSHIAKAKMPDREQVRDSCHRQTIKNPKPVIHRYAIVGACAVVLVLFIWLVPGIFNRQASNNLGGSAPEISHNGPTAQIPEASQSGESSEYIAETPETSQNEGDLIITPQPPTSTSDIDFTAIKGLPVNNFILTDIPTHSESEAPSIEMMRLPLSNLTDFFLYQEPEAFVFARVISTERRVREARFRDVYEQVSTVHILSEIWSQDGDMPETIQVVQSIQIGTEMWVDPSGIMQAIENTNLLREGGVYMLPLVYVSWLGAWVSLGNDEVKFEIDDSGLVWSHSAKEGFRQFDGKAAQTLAEAVKTLTHDENFAAFNHGFGRYVARGVLAEVTVISIATTRPTNRSATYQYTLDIVNAVTLLSQPKPGDTISATIHAETRIYYETGGHYLMLLQFSGGTFYPGAVAIINPDGTITSTTLERYSCMIREFNGHTIQQMFELAMRAQAWYERHVRI